MFKKKSPKKEAIISDESTENMIGSGEDFSASNEEGNISIDDGEAIYIENNSEQAKNPTKLKTLLKRILLGIIIISIGGGALVLGQTLGSGEDVTTISSSPVKAENNNKLVYLKGTPTPNDFNDQLFNVSVNSLGLIRVVEMYQWSSENGQYTKKWSEELIKINDEEAKNKGFANPTELPIHSEKWLSTKITIGSFTISPELANKIISTTPLPMNDENFKKLNQEGQQAFKLSDRGYFFGINPAKPNIGDLRISFKSSTVSPVSILAKQLGDSITPYPGKNGKIAIIRQGNIDLKTISQGVNLGGNSIITMASFAISGLFGIIGILIIIGKFSRKNKNQAVDSEYKEKSKKKIINPTKSKNKISDNVIEELDIMEVNNTSNPPSKLLNKIIPKDNVYNSEENAYGTDPILAVSQEIMLENIKHVVDPAEIKMEADSPFEFPSEEAPHINIRSQLQEFGILDEPTENSHIIPDTKEELPPLHMTSNNNSHTESYLTTNYQDNDSNISQHLEMPSGIDFLSDEIPLETNNNLSSLELNHGGIFDIPSESNVNTSPPKEKQKISYTNNAYSETYSESFYEDSTEIPEGVEVISESSIFEETQADSNNHLDTTIKNDTQVIDFYPDKAYESHEEIQINTGDPIEFESSPEPQIDNGNILFEEEVQESPIQDIPLTLQSAPDSNDIIIPEHVEEEVIASNVSPAQLPPAPDFDSLFALMPPPPAPPKKAPASIFELPPLPEDFDPNAEMTTPKEAYTPDLADENNDLNDDHFLHIDDGSHSPFGGVEDPFAIPTDEKK